MMIVDTLWMENGIVLVWEWGVKDGQEVPVNYTQLPDVIPNWKPEINGYALESTPVFVGDLDTLGRGWNPPGSESQIWRDKYPTGGPSDLDSKISTVNA